MSRIAGFAVLLVAVAPAGCAPPPQPTLAASAEALKAAAAEAVQSARNAKEMEEAFPSLERPRRPGDALLGSWGVTTRERFPFLTAYQARTAAGEVRSAGKEGDRISELIRLSARVKVFPLYLEVHRPSQPVVSREYDVLRDTGREVEIQLRGGDGERAVVTFRGEDEVDVESLVDLTGGEIWQRDPPPRD